MPHGYSHRKTIALIALLMLSCPAIADDDRDDKRERSHHHQNQLRDSVQRGEIKPLSEVLAIVKPNLPGEIVGIEVERKAARWMYELRVLDAQGRVFDAHVDAATAAIIEIEEK